MRKLAACDKKFSMKPIKTIILNCIVLWLAMNLHALAQKIERADLQHIFSDAEVQGTIAIYSPTRDRMVLINAERAAKRYIPASTFKIANSLIAMETGAVKNENEIIPYGGKPQIIKSWEQDMSMRDAIKISNVPVYQEIANRVGKQRYLEWLKRLEYGNQKVGSDVQTFWLEGPLEISAIEQAKFLAQLATRNLAASKSNQSIVADILRLEKSEQGTLFGKTGWTSTPNPDIGWFVGWIVKDEENHAFAFNMDIKSKADARKRKSLAMGILQKLGLL